ncbi:hypothetical protein FACS189426_06390 [Bacteroidia bacterium]|nr:hypothetical protein FACS189426_06390 [Bacteroidia bacterium]
MMETFGKITLHNGDCMEVLKSLPDNAFDLAICDPPYGIGASEMTMGSGKNKRFEKGKKWDKTPPPPEYFQELQRVSNNQIIWGGNYFNLPLTKSWIVWDKGIYWETSFADCEMAWTSFNRVARIAPIRYNGFLGEDKVRIHPTQKPVKLCEDRAIAEMRGYLSRRYDCNRIFSATGADRNQLILMMAIDIAVYHIFCIHNPQKMSQIRKDRYSRAMEWLKQVADEDISIDGAPLLPEEELLAKATFLIRSNRKRVNHY